MAMEPQRDTDGQRTSWAGVIASITIGALVGAIIGAILGFALNDFSYLGVAIAVGAGIGIAYFYGRQGFR